MQLAALETPTRCLVLAGKKPPMTMVTRKARTGTSRLLRQKKA